ncbi:hypothetical protein [Streptomyces vinaceusdrappus]|nr:hypothetical protein [Streptomyces vinaceusdrappus]GHC37376.1 hypothetical protein GCM10010308_64940 [Streptomyces vinaceusdrappus]
MTPEQIGRMLADLQRRMDRIENSPRLSHAAIDNTSVQVKDGNGNLRALLGVQGDGTTAVNIVNGPPPPVPTAPILAPVLGGVTASWDGGFADGAVIPMDWARVEVHASPDAGFEPVPATLVTTIETAQGATVVVPAEGDVLVRLVARNTSGAASAPSAVAGPVGPAPVVADEILDGIVTASKIAAGAVNINALTESLADTASQRYVDAMADPTAWTVLAQAPGGSWTFLTGVADAPTGSTVAQATGYTAVRGVVQMPYDPDVLYRVSVRVRTTAASAAGSDTVYLGVLGIAGDGVTLVNRTGANSSGAQFYVAASNAAQPTASGFVTYTGYLRGRASSGMGGTAPDPRTPGAVHTDVRYIAPLAYLNFASGTSGSTGTMQIDAFTLEALKTGVVGSSNLVAGSVTTAALAADSVTATAIAANAVTAAKIDAGAVTTGKLDALAVTSDKIAANAITAGKILAGSVDATALAADAITGKTITGGTITGSMIQTALTGERITLNEADVNKVLVYNENDVAINELSARGLLVQGTSGAIIWLNPNLTYPAMSLYNAAQTNAAHVAVTEPVTGDANLELISGTFPGSGYTKVVWRAALTRDAAAIERYTTDVNPARKIGGRLFLNSALTSVGYINDDATTQNTSLNVEANYVTVNNGRFSVSAPASTFSTLYVEGNTAQTGPLLRVYRDSDKFVVDKDGAVTVAGRVKPMTGESASLALQSGWTNYDATNYGSATVRKTADGMAYLYGRLQAGTVTSGTLIATIPSGAGYWPLVRHAFPHRAPQGGVDVTILVSETGELRIYDISGTITNLSLSGIFWPTW